MKSEGTEITRVLVIGYGNPLRGDDGLGPFVADRLKSFLEAAQFDEGKPPEGRGKSADRNVTPAFLSAELVSGHKERIEVIETHQLLPELSENISGSKAVIFVDACCDTPPGRISVKKVERRSPPPRTTSHEIEPSDLLEYAGRIYGRQPEVALLLTVGGKSFGYGEGLSATVSAATTKLITIISNITRRWASCLPEKEITVGP